MNNPTKITFLLIFIAFDYFYFHITFLSILGFVLLCVYPIRLIKFGWFLMPALYLIALSIFGMSLNKIVNKGVVEIYCNEKYDSKITGSYLTYSFYIYEGVLAWEGFNGFYSGNSFYNNWTNKVECN